MGYWAALGGADWGLGGMQEAGEEAARAQGRTEEGQAAAREAFQQASAHARSAQQAEARCQVLEQAVHRAEGRAQASAHLQQVSLHQTGAYCFGFLALFLSLFWGSLLTLPTDWALLPIPDSMHSQSKLL